MDIRVASAGELAELAAAALDDRRWSEMAELARHGVRHFPARQPVGGWAAVAEYAEQRAAEAASVASFMAQIAALDAADAAREAAESARS